MQERKVREACVLSREACQFLRHYRRASAVPPSTLPQLHHVLNQLLLCVSILASFEAASEPLLDVYNALAVALRQVMDFTVDSGGDTAMEEATAAESRCPAPFTREHCGADVGWADIVGCEDAIVALQQATLLPQRLPSLFTGARQRWRCVLLYGPPGTGKTLLARAAAAGSGATLHCVSSADILSKWVGESERHVRELFARAAAERGPSIVFLDEIDALCAARGAHGETEAARRVKTELLLHLQSPPPNTTVIGATNLPWELDAAVRRRFNRFVHVDLPGLGAREILVKQQLASIPHTLTAANIAAVARATEGYSASDVVRAVSHALMAPLAPLADAGALRVATAAEVRRRWRPPLHTEQSQACERSASSPASNACGKRARSLETVSESSATSTTSRQAAMVTAAVPYQPRRNIVILPRRKHTRSTFSSLATAAVTAVADRHSDSSDEQHSGGEDLSEVFYVPCSASHPRALATLPPASVREDHVLIPPVTYKDFVGALTLSAPSSTPEEIDRFKEWRGGGHHR